MNEATCEFATDVYIKINCFSKFKHFCKSKKVRLTCNKLKEIYAYRLDLTYSFLNLTDLTCKYTYVKSEVKQSLDDKLKKYFSKFK